MMFQKIILFVCCIFFFQYQHAKVMSPYPLLGQSSSQQTSELFAKTGIASIIKISSLISITSLLCICEYQSILQEMENNPYITSILVYLFMNGLYKIGTHEYHKFKQSFFNFYFLRITLLLIIASHIQETFMSIKKRSSTSLIMNQFIVESEQCIFKIQNLQEQLTNYFTKHYNKQPLFDYDINHFTTQQVLNLASYDDNLYKLLVSFYDSNHPGTYKEIYNELEQQFHKYHKRILLINQL